MSDLLFHTIFWSLAVICGILFAWVMRMARRLDAQGNDYDHLQARCNELSKKAQADENEINHLLEQIANYKERRDAALKGIPCKHCVDGRCVCFKE